MEKIDQAMFYMVIACVIAGFGYHIPFCINIAIGMCLGIFVSCSILFVEEWNRTRKEIKQMEEDSKKLDIVLEFVRQKPQYESKIPDSKGCYDPTQSSPE